MVVKKTRRLVMEAAVMAAVQKLLSIASVTEAEGVPTWKSIPSWYLVYTDDQMIPPSAQRSLAKRMNATVRSISFEPRPRHDRRRSPISSRLPPTLSPSPRKIHNHRPPRATQTEEATVPKIEMAEITLN